MLKKPSALLAILVVISVLTVSGLYVYHDEVRSDLVVDFPGSVWSIKHEGSRYTVGSDSLSINAMESQYCIELIEDSRKYCTLNASFMYALNYPRVSLEYKFWSEKDSFVPQGSECIYSNEGKSTYRYLDGITGHELLFHLIENRLDYVDFSGKTMIRHDGELKPVDFNLHIWYDQNFDYVQHYVNYSLPDATISFNIKGLENGIEKRGTVTIEPVISKAEYGSNGSIYHTINIAHISIDIEGTSLPEAALDFYAMDHDDPVRGYTHEIPQQFLTAENIFVESNMQNSLLYFGEERMFNLKGTISTTTFEREEAVTATLEFSYEVV